MGPPKSALLHTGIHRTFSYVTLPPSTVSVASPFQRIAYRGAPSTRALLPPTASLPNPLPSAYLDLRAQHNPNITLTLEALALETLTLRPKLGHQPRIHQRTPFTLTLALNLTLTWVLSSSKLFSMCSALINYGNVTS